MDELSEKLAGILNDPQSMDRVRQMAQNLLGQGDEVQPPPTAASGIAALLSGEGMPDAGELKKIMNILSKVKSGGDDSRTKLLLALKPNLSEPRREKVDTAVKLLKLIELLPYIRELGILDI